jgi:serine/threonine protein kinase
MSLPAGTRLGAYEVVALLGRGGMGEVYRARDVRLERDVAIKVLAPQLTSDVRLRDRFEREARLIASLNHPHICTIHDIGSSPGQDAETQFLVMEHLEGETLAERLRHGRLSVDQLLRWGAEAADGLDAAHARGLVHRDIKPANLFITNSGSIKVLDFGLARLASTDGVADAETLAATQPGTVLGTIAYMSPEQARGDAVDARSDVFSLGAVLYEAVTGRMAFSGATPATVYDAILNRSAPPLRSLVSDIPPGLAAVIERAIEKEPARRYGRAGEVATALRALTKSAAPPSAGAGAQVPSIAVLAFVDLSPQGDREWFCDGIAEELIGALARIPGLRVASRTSSFRFRNAADVRAIGEQLGVEWILEGSVRSAGDRVRVTAQLTKVIDGYQVWSERYDRQVDDIFAIQDDIARTIVRALQVQLLGDPDAAIVRAQTRNREAYELCLKGRYAWHRQNYSQAAALFAQALQYDSDYALPHFGLGDCVIGAWVSGLGDRTSPAQARALFERAIALDPALAEAHALLGVVLGMGFWDWRASEASFATALRLNPESAHVCMSWSLILLQMGRTDDAIAMARRGIALESMVPTWYWHVAIVLCARGDWLEAVEQARAALALDPACWMASVVEALALGLLGRVDEGVAAANRAVEDSGRASFPLGYLGSLLALAGRRDDAQRILDELLERHSRGAATPTNVAVIYMALGHRDQGLDWLDRAVDAHDPQTAYALRLPTAPGIRDDHRFASLEQRVFAR